jgi:hypothetical protein
LKDRIGFTDSENDLFVTSYVLEMDTDIFKAEWFQTLS